MAVVVVSESEVRADQVPDASVVDDRVEVHPVVFGVARLRVVVGLELALVCAVEGVQHLFFAAAVQRVGCSERASRSDAHRGPALSVAFVVDGLRQLIGFPVAFVRMQVSAVLPRAPLAVFAGFGLEVLRVVLELFPSVALVAGFVVVAAAVFVLGDLVLHVPLLADLCFVVRYRLRVSSEVLHVVCILACALFVHVSERTVDGFVIKAEELMRLSHAVQ